MNFQGTIGFFTVGMFVLLGFILAVYGAVSSRMELITIGIGIVGPISGAVIDHFFPGIIEQIRQPWFKK